MFPRSVWGRVNSAPLGDSCVLHGRVDDTGETCAPGEFKPRPAPCRSRELSSELLRWKGDGDWATTGL